MVNRMCTRERNLTMETLPVKDVVTGVEERGPAWPSCSLTREVLADWSGKSVCIHSSDVFTPVLDIKASSVRGPEREHQSDPIPLAFTDHNPCYHNACRQLSRDPPCPTAPGRRVWKNQKAIKHKMKAYCGQNILAQNLSKCSSCGIVVEQLWKKALPARFSADLVGGAIMAGEKFLLCCEGTALRVYRMDDGTLAAESTAFLNE
ncbi:hypothetical protein ACOMHN_004192 [Nucella lapillus]